MAALSDYAEKAVLDWLLTNQSVTRPTAWYLALYTSATNDAGGPGELSGNGYSRQALNFAPASSPGGTTQNSNVATFTAAGGNWGAITHLGIFDAPTGGNLLLHGALQNARTVLDGDDLEFTVGQIAATLA